MSTQNDSDASGLNHNDSAMPIETPGDRLRKLRNAAGLTLEELAKAIKVTTMTVSRYESGKTPMSLSRAEEFAKVLNVSSPDILGTAYLARKLVPLIGTVGRDDMYYGDPQAGKWEQVEPIEAPPEAGDVQAVRVVGNSMAPAYREGDVLYFSRSRGNPADFVGDDCIVQVRGGEAFLKILKKSSRSGKYALGSYNRETPDIDGVDVEWAARIVWCKRGHRTNK